MSPTSVLVVDDEPSMLRYMQTLLELESFKVSTASHGNDGIRQIESGLKPDLVFLDLLMPDIDGLQTLERMRRIDPNLKVVMLSCVSETAKVVESMRLGAQDYLNKPFKRTDLDSVLQRCVTPAFGVAEQISCEMEELGDDTFFLAASPAMKRIRSEVALVANVDVPVLVLGESGTGKEVVARLIHKRSPRSHRTFMKVNCAALPGELLESELFGYEAGAFTGANKSKPGKFELCNKGTLLLDEIGEMPSQLQAKLLHVLQDGEFSRLGSRSSVRVDVRVIAATNIDIQKGMADKSFREDLYYRLNAFTLHVPPLRERREEIPLLLKHMTQRMAESYGRVLPQLSPRLVDACVRAQWPGNVRELGNFVKRYLILGDENAAIAELQSGMGSTSDTAVQRSASGSDLKVMVRGLKDEAEASAISRVLAQTGWNRKAAAAILNISYKALLYKIRQYNLRPVRGGRSLSFAERDVN
jgi:two-component system response regulator AtoC